LADDLGVFVGIGACWKALIVDIGVGPSIDQVLGSKDGGMTSISCSPTVPHWTYLRCQR
jgi:hypothetical protein